MCLSKSQESPLNNLDRMDKECGKKHLECCWLAHRTMNSVSLVCIRPFAVNYAVCGILTKIHRTMYNTWSCASDRLSNGYLQWLFGDQRLGNVTGAHQLRKVANQDPGFGGYKTRSGVQRTSPVPLRRCSFLAFSTRKGQWLGALLGL
jgi:hypothetical protein